MIYLFVCRDVPASKALRKRYLNQHLAYIETVMHRIAVAGPCLTRGSESDTDASVLAFEADSRQEAEALFRQDPYHRHGVWTSYEVFTFKPVVGTWVGGKSW